MIQTFTALLEQGERIPLYHILFTVIAIAFIVVITMVAARICARVLLKIEDRMRQGRDPRTAVVSFARYLAIGLIYFGGFAAVVSCIPALESTINKLMAAGGVLAVIAGLAAQKALGDMVSGLMILAFRPFLIGDVIRVVDKDLTGTVEEITLQHTAIRTGENKRIIVPNSIMSNTIVENADYHDKKVCWFLEIGTGYAADTAQAKAIMAAQIAAHPSFLDMRTPAQKEAGEPEVTVRVKELGDSAVVLRAAVWAKDNGTAAAMKSDLLEQMKQAFDEAGIEIPYPQVTVHRQSAAGGE